MARPRPESIADTPSQIDRVVLALREMLLRGEFRPGERLAELTLVPRLGASRTPVRLALDRLAHEGLLERSTTTGFRVRAFSLGDIRDAIELRGVLEGTAARLAAERLTDPSELARLRECCREADALLPMTRERFLRYIDLNEEYHQELWRLAKSRMLQRSIANLTALPFAAPGALVFSDEHGVHSEIETVVALEHHRAIADAIAGREGGRAEALAREHARLALRALSRALEHADRFNRVPGAPLVTD